MAILPENARAKAVLPHGVDPIVKEARERWQRCNDAEDAQRTRIVAAKKFRAGDQWDPAIRAAREGKNGLQGQAPQPPRPCLTIDRLSQPVRQVSNQIKTANFAIDVVPQGSGADQETAEIFKGYLRRVQNQARGESPIEWAADGAIEGGIGWFRIRTEYVIEAPDPSQPATIEAFDQELRMERITNNLTVYCDPSASKPTRSDARFMFVTEDLAKEEFASRWPKAKLDSLEAFAATGDTQGWVTEDEIRIAEYWRVVFKDEQWALMQDRSVVPFPAELKETPEGVLAIRTVRRPVIEGYKINACEVLETLPWVGSRIPLIPILGEELNVDGLTMLRGLIEEGMDAQRMVNYTYSGAIENFALGNKAPFIAAAGQIDNYQAIWQTANTYNYSYLPYDPVSIAGTVLPPPQRQQAEPPIQAAVDLMRVSEECIKATTGIFDPALGKENPRERSGRAIQALQGQSDLSSSNYGDSVSRALIYAGELMVEVLPKITRPGQILHVLGIDDQPEQVMVGQHFTQDDQGRPQPLPQGANPEQAMQEGIAQFYDLTRGRYAVTVRVGKASATKREEGAAALGELIPHLPEQMAAVATPDYVEQLDFEGSHKIAEKLRKALPPELQDTEEGAPDPEKQQLQAMVAQLQQALEGKQAEEQAKQQAALQKAQLESQTDLQKAELDRQTRLDIAQIQANATIASAEVKVGSEDLDRRLKLIELFLTAEKERRLDHADKEHETVLTHAQIAHEKELAEQEHEHALEQGEQTAALTPTNGSGSE